MDLENTHFEGGMCAIEIPRLCLSLSLSNQVAIHCGGPDLHVSAFRSLFTGSGFTLGNWDVS